MVLRKQTKHFHEHVEEVFNAQGVSNKWKKIRRSNYTGSTKKSFFDTVGPLMESTNLLGSFSAECGSIFLHVLNTLGLFAYYYF